MKQLSVARAVILAGVIGLAPVVAVPLLAQGAPTSIRPGFNLYTTDQDIQIGQQAAAQAEQQLQLINDAGLNAYLNQIIQRLAAVAPGAKYPYHIKAVNSSDINAFALPGGPMYVNRGLISAAGSEAELVGVLAHEMSHVALRHGTHQASTASLAETGLGVLGGLLSRNGRGSDVINAIGGFGLNAAFLKFSRTYEYQADQTGAEIMARAGYNPTAMADFFEKLRAEQGRDPSKLEQFFSDHPPTADREARIRQLAQTLRPVGGVSDIGGLAQAKATLAGMPAAPATQVAQQTAPATSGGSPSPEPASSQPSQPANVAAIAAPSTRYARFSQSSGFFSITYPSNWRAAQASTGVGASIMPDGGVVDAGNGRQDIVEGVIVNHYDPFVAGTTGTLQEATNDLLTQLQRANTYLRPQAEMRAITTGGARGYQVTLAGTSPVTGQAEQVTVVTRALPDGHVMYVLGIAPGAQAASFNRAFTKMVRSLRVNDSAAHRSQ